MKKIIPLLIITILISSCSGNKNDDKKSTSCNFKTLKSAAQYQNSPSSQLEINSLKINGNCLTVNFSSSGCNGGTWELKLIDSERVLKSNPPQRSLKLSLKNEELCEAYITKEVTFDISNLQTGGNKVLLNITNVDKSITYEY